MSKIRSNRDIKYVIIQHTGDSIPITATELNQYHLQMGDYGPPYDIIIDSFGNLSLSQRWTRSQKRELLEVNASFYKIFYYKEHFYIDILPIYYQDKSLVIGVIGDFDNVRPNSFIYNTLVKVLTEINNNLNIDLYTDLLYYYEIYNTTSPGVFFFDKIKLIKDVTKAKKSVFIPYIYKKEIVDTGGIIDKEQSKEEDISGVLLYEDNTIMFSEDNTYIQLE